MKTKILSMALILLSAQAFAGFEVMDSETANERDRGYDPQPVQTAPPPAREDMTWWETMRYSNVPLRSWYFRIGVGDSRMDLSGVENISSTVAVRNVPVNQSAFHERKTNFMGAFGWRTPQWLVEAELLYYKTFHFNYDPLLASDIPGAAPSHGLPTHLLRGEYSLQQWIVFANFLYKFPRLAMQSKNLDFYSLLGLGAAYMSANVETSGRVPGSTAYTHPIVVAQSREVAHRSKANIVGQIGGGAHYYLFPRLFVDMSFRWSEQGAIKMGPVEGQTILGNDGVEVRVARVKNVGVYAGIGVPFN